jgi:opacity protein-like surface antigen
MIRIVTALLALIFATTAHADKKDALTGLSIGVHGGLLRFTPSDAPDGTLFGAHIGYAARYSGIIVGIEGDMSFQGVNTTDSTIALTYNTDWIASIRARLGYEVLTGLALYATAGPAWVSAGSNQAQIWQIGGGAQWALTDTLSVRGEVIQSFDTLEHLRDGQTMFRIGATVRVW